ncbi:MAG TPA: ABC transporter ATP-binding protein [Gemmatimonadales bacterium]|nr:ABC transporter ATP-binding protein [Gemmatimonadales bacterium]
MKLETSALTVRYPGLDRAALEGVALSVSDGRLVAVVGPNGSGKTTLLRALTGAVVPSAGSVLLEGRSIHGWRPPELARMLAVVTQREEPAFPLKVPEAVLLGRYAHLGPFAAATPADLQSVALAMNRCDVDGMAERRIDTLSGGEWQRVRLARALAQEPRLLVLDEPTAALDVRHEMQIFELVRRLVDEGLGAVVVTHHLNLAARYADELLLLSQGRMAAQGRPAEVLQAEILERVFEWPIAVTPWRDGSPQVVPLRPREADPSRTGAT